MPTSYSIGMPSSYLCETYYTRILTRRLSNKIAGNDRIYKKIDKEFADTKYWGIKRV